MEFEPTQWYAVSLAALVACLIVLRLRYPSLFINLPFKYSTLKHYTLNFAQALAAQYFHCIRITRLQVFMVVLYYSINGLCMGLSIRSDFVVNDLLVRSGMMASVNLIPLFLGGRTNMLADYLGISIHTYYLAHHWIGRMVIIQSLLHVALAITARRPWTFDSSQISGITAVSALALLFLLSLYFIRRLAYEFFLNVHAIVAFTAAIAILFHILSTKPSRGSAASRSIYVVVALSLWTLGTFIRIFRMIYHNFGSRRRGTGQGIVSHYMDGPKGKNVSAMELSVHLRRPVRICSPGVYCYLTFSDMGLRRRWESHPYVITWWDNSERATNLRFLIQPHDGISADLISRKSFRYVGIDGLYGKDLHLDKCETVILAAKGIGIAGILPYVRHLTYRRTSKAKEHETYRRELITRKIDVFWILEENHQQDWASEWITELRKRDSENLILTFTCFYPQKQSTPPPVSPDPHWRFIYRQEPYDIIGDLVKKQVQRSPGQTKIIVCGDATFDSQVRSQVHKTMNEYESVDLSSTEFQPKVVVKSYPEVHAMEREDIEMQSVTAIREKKTTRSRFSTFSKTGRKKKHDNVEDTKSQTPKQTDKLDIIDEDNVSLNSPSSSERMEVHEVV